MEKNLLLIALPRAAMCMQFPAQGVERGAPMFCTETKSSWLLGSGSCSIPRHLFCRVPTPHPKLLTPGSQPQRAAPRNAQCADPKVLLVVLAVCLGPLPGRAPPQGRGGVGGSLAGPQLRVRGVFAGICHHLPKWLFSFLFPFNSNQS